MVPMVRSMLISSAVFKFIPAALWIASIHVEHTARLVLIWVAIPLGMCLDSLSSRIPPSLKLTPNCAARTVWNGNLHLPYSGLGAL